MGKKKTVSFDNVENEIVIVEPQRFEKSKDEIISDIKKLKEELTDLRRQSAIKNKSIKTAEKKLYD